MIARLKLLIRTPVSACSAFLLAACSSPVSVAPVALQNPIISGKMSSGVITDARPVALAGNQTSVQYGISGVLAALHEPTARPALDATEFVVRRDDGTTVSLVTRLSTANAGERASANNFTIGDSVEIIDGIQPELTHRD
jgi:hypothetical protein